MGGVGRRADAAHRRRRRGLQRRRHLGCHPGPDSPRFPPPVGGGHHPRRRQQRWNRRRRGAVGERRARPRFRRCPAHQEPRVRRQPEGGVRARRPARAWTSSCCFTATVSTRPSSCPRSSAPIVEGSADAVFGSRMMTPGAARRGGMPLYKYVGNRVLTRMENRLLGTDLTEFHSGYRAYRVAALRELPLASTTTGSTSTPRSSSSSSTPGSGSSRSRSRRTTGTRSATSTACEYAWDVTLDVLVYRLSKMGFGTSRWVSHPAEYDFKEGDGSSHTLLLDMARNVSPGRVLDLGCSGGLLAQQLRALGHRVVGADCPGAAGGAEPSRRVPRRRPVYR